jgi:replicative DNA helicase
MRRLIGAAGRIAAIAYADSADVPLALERAEQELFAVTQVRATREFVHIRDLLAEYLESIQLGVSGETARPGVPTGFIDLDRLLGGMQRSDLVILAARPSLGKTALALNMARNAGVRFNLTTAIFSVEMSRLQVAQRFLCTESGVDSARVREGRINDGEIRRLTEALETLSAAPIYVDDTPSIGINELRAKARRLHSEHPLDLLIVDYLQLVGGANPQNRVQEMSEVSRSLKALARELDIPVLALSQLSRAVESRSPHIPMLSDLRDSGSIEQDADVVLFIYREDVYDRETERKGITDLYVAKHRNGPTGMVSLLFQEQSTRFVDLAREPRLG